MKQFTDKILSYKTSKIILACFTVFTFILLVSPYYMRYSYKIGLNSDIATTLIQVRDILSGNIFLNDWIVGYGSYYTTSVLSHLLVSLFMGVTEQVLYTVPGILYAILVVVCVILGGSGKEKFNVFNALIVFCLIGLPSLYSTDSLLNGTIHVEAYIYMFIGFLILDKLSNNLKKNLFIFIVYFILQLFMYMGDVYATFFSLMPIIIVCLSRILLVRKPIIDSIILIVSTFAFIMSRILLNIIEATGGMKYLGAAGTMFIQSDELVPNIVFAFKAFLEFFSAQFFGQELKNINTIKILPNVLILLIGFLILYFIIKRIHRYSRVDMMLVATIIVTVLAFIFSIMSSLTRYLIPAVLCLFVLMGRYGILYHLKKSTYNKKQFIILTCTVSVLFTSCFISKIVPLPEHKSVLSYENLSTFLQKKNLTQGFGEFWSSSVVSTNSEFSVRVAPIMLDNGFLRQHFSLCSSQWYNQYGNFIVSKPNESFGITEESVSAILGEPQNTYYLNNEYIIMVWNYDISQHIYTKKRDTLGHYPAPAFLVSGDCFVEKNRYVIPENSALFGPYVDLEKGNYSVVVSGENLDLADMDIVGNHAQTHILPNVTDLTPNEVRYNFTLTEDTDKVEFRFFNKKDAGVFIKFDGLNLSKIPTVV